MKESVVADLNRARTEWHFSLTDVANSHGFTRERARQLFNKLFGYSYGPIQRNLQIEINKQIKAYKQDTRFRNTFYDGSNRKHAYAETKFLERYKGKTSFYGIKTKRSNLRFFMLNNQNLVRVRSRNTTHITSEGNGIPYFVFRLFGQEKEIADFFAFYVVPRDCFFIVPKSGIRGLYFYVPEYPTNYKASKQEYLKYIENWQILDGTFYKTTNKNG